MRAIGRWAGMLAAMLLAQLANAACQVVQAAELPVTMDGLRPMLHVRMEGTDQRLLLDTGAFYSTMSSATAAALKIKERSANGLVVGGVGGTFEAKAGYVRSLAFGKVRMTNVGFVIGGSETGVAGLLGQDVLHGFDSEYDFAHGMARLLQPKDCAGQSLAYWAKDGYAMIPVEGTTQLNPHVIGTVRVNNIKLRAMLDTGASTSMLSLAAAARLGVRPGGGDVREAGYARGVGSGTIKTWTGPFASFAIGQEEIRHIRLRFGDFDMERVDMVIGADFFLSHRVLIATSQNKVYLTYNGGPVFALADDAGAMPATGPVEAALLTDVAPDTADGHARRGAASIARGNLPAALADLDRAVAMEPERASHLAQRAALHVRMKHDDLAAADLDRAITLRPDDADQRLSRAALLLRREDRKGALADLDHAAKVLPDQADLRLSLASLYESADAFPRAVEQYGRWMKVHPVDSQRADALNGRCWARALGGIELGAALADCNTALYLAPKSASVLDSRALVRLRSGDMERALADYDAALAIEPDIAWSLFGRALIERKRGQTTKADADLAAARKADAKIEQRAERLRIRI